MSAIRRGATPEARGILNGLLVHIMVQCQGDLERSKSFFMELVVTLYRTAIEAGGKPEALLGDNYARMTELADIKDQESLAAWLHTMLDTIIAHIHECTNPVDPAMERAVLFIRTNATQRLRRDDAARVAGFSGAHFSRLLRSRYGRSFTDILTQCRVDEACGLLRKTTLPIAAVALRAGFSDQSYFTKVFRKATGKTPYRYRTMHRAQ
jgi:AraC-like DNA-binding protein